MKNLLISVLTIFTTFSLIGQYDYIDIVTGDIVEVTCPNDPNVSINSYENYEIYQTVDDLANGERLPICLNVNSSDGSIPINEIDVSRAVFIRYIGDTIFLESNNVYSTSQFGFSESGLIFDVDNDCTNDLCSGVIIEFLHSGPSGTAYPSQVIFPFTNPKTSYIDAECIVTEKTDLNMITSFIFKFHIEEIVSGGFIRLNDLFLSQSYSDVIEQQVVIAEENWDGEKYAIRTQTLSQDYQFIKIVKHHEPGVPTSQNISYTTLNPEINSSTPKTIELAINRYEMDLLFQRNCQLRPGLLEGSATERHELIIEDLGGNMCFTSVEIVINDDTELKIGGGVNIDNKTGCIQVQHEGVLSFVGEGFQHYGYAGVGNLYLREGAIVNLDKGSHLYFDGHLILSQAVEPEIGDSLIIDLKEGRTLTFTEASSIQSMDGSKLYINMLGGTIDIEGLEVDSRANIVLLYPETEENNLNSSLTVFPNPSSDYIFINSVKEDLISHIHFYTLEGRLVSVANQSNGKVDGARLEKGIYLMKVYFNDGRSDLVRVIIQ